MSQAGHNSIDWDEVNSLYAEFEVHHGRYLDLGRKSAQEAWNAAQCLAGVRAMFPPRSGWAAFLETKGLAERTAYEYVMIGRYIGAKHRYSGMKEMFEAAMDAYDEERQQAAVDKQAEAEAAELEALDRKAEARTAEEASQAEADLESAQAKRADADSEVKRAEKQAAARSAGREAAMVPDSAREIHRGYKALNSRQESRQDSNEWYTPAQVMEMAREVYGEVDLDPASCQAANLGVQAKRIFTEQDDGLAQDWEAGTVWLNPPYLAPHHVKREDWLEAWLDKVVGGMESGAIGEAIVLLNADTDTGWFHRAMETACAVAFWRGRVSFWGPLDPDGGGGPPRGQCLFYYGERVDSFCEVFGREGIALVLPVPPGQGR